jgi:hypothetical protein
MREISEKVARLFAEVDKELDADGAADFIQALAHGIGAFIALHYSEEDFGELVAVVGRHVEQSAIITSMLPEVLIIKAKKNEK